MWKESSILVNTASRLGLPNGPILKKAEELLRSFQAKGSLRTISDVAQAVLCLDLASTHTGEPFDKETAIKLSGLKKSVYQTNLHTIEKMLGLDKQLTVSELCVQLSCTEVNKLAEEILEKYVKSHEMLNDLSHPQYIAAAVYSSCKLRNLKVQKPQFIEASRLKPAQWKELSLEFEKFSATIDRGHGRKNKKSDSKNTVELAADIENKTVSKKKEPDEVEDYEVWKERILEEAYAALKSKDIAKC